MPLAAGTAWAPPGNKTAKSTAGLTTSCPGSPGEGDVCVTEQGKWCGQEPDQTRGEQEQKKGQVWLGLQHSAGHKGAHAPLHPAPPQQFRARRGLGKAESCQVLPGLKPPLAHTWELSR